VLGHHRCGRQSRYRLERRYFTGPTPPRPEEVTSAFWGACHGGQEPCAAFLLQRRTSADLRRLKHLLQVSTISGSEPEETAS
jgi:hypothetical protein